MSLLPVRPFTALCTGILLRSSTGGTTEPLHSSAPLPCKLFFFAFLKSKLSTVQWSCHARYQHLHQLNRYIQRFRFPLPTMAQHPTRGFHHCLPWWMGHLSMADPKVSPESDYLLVWIRYRPCPSTSYHGELYTLMCRQTTSSCAQITDYYLVRKRQLHVPMLYQNEGIYRYKGGVNWRAVVALAVVIPINLPGLINAIDKSVDIGNHKFFCTSLTTASVSQEYRYRILISLLDRASWLTSFFICASIYLILSKISPPHSTFVDRTVESLDDEAPHGDVHGWEKNGHNRSDSDSEKIVSPSSTDHKPPQLA